MIDADALHRDSIIIDAHSDALSPVLDGKRHLGQRSDAGQLDLPRALEGGVTGVLAAMCLDKGRGAMDAHQMLRFVDAYYEELAANPQVAMPALQARDFRQAKRLGKVGLMLALEGAEGLQGDLGVLRLCHRLGMRCLTITWSRRNEAADGVWEARTGGGLTNFGVQLVKECNRLGIVLDISHLAPAGVQDVLELSEAPIIASHANCHALRAQPRNLTDAQLEAMARKGGVVGVTLVPAFLGEYDRHAPLEAVLEHIDHLVRVMGEDGVGLGTDFDGVGDARVQDLEDASKLANLTRGLVSRGYTAATIRKILGGNFLRVFQAVLGGQDSW